MIELDKINPIGIGTYKLDLENKDKTLQSLLYSVNKGGLIDFCKANNIKFVCYQALRRNNIVKMNYPFLVELANKYNKTQNQILLNWMIKEKGLNTIIKTNTIQNIDSNLQSLDFTLENKDIELLNNFQDKRFNSIEIDWKNQGGVTIDKLASQFKIN